MNPHGCMGSQLKVLFGVHFYETLFQAYQMKGTWTSDFIPELEVHQQNVCKCVCLCPCELMCM